MLVTFAIVTDSTPCAPLLAATDEFPRDNAFSPRVREKASERPERGSQANHRDERQQAADDRHHDDIEIVFSVGRVADREQSDNGAVVRQAVERAGANDRDTMQQRRVDPLLVDR